MTTITDTTGHRHADAPQAGPATPLTAAYCAERAALALHTAAGPAPGEFVAAQVHVADGWRRLAELLATHPGANRPRDDDDNRRR